MLTPATETRNPQAHGTPVVNTDPNAFPMPAMPASAMGSFSFVSNPTTDPVVKYTIEQAMSQMRAADRKTRQMLLIDASAKQLAFNIAAYEDAVQEEQEQNHAADAPMNDDH